MFWCFGRVGKSDIYVFPLSIWISLVEYFFSKNLELHAEYSRVNDRNLEKHDYNLVDVELDFRF